MTQQIYPLHNKKIWIAGSKGMVGSAIIRALKKKYTCTILATSRKELDLEKKSAVQNFVKKKQPDVCFLTAAKVGGIYANTTYPVNFILNNLQIQCNVIEACACNGVEKLVFLGSSCVYPKFSAQPIEESALLSASLEPTNEFYAIAKISGIKLVEAYRKQYAHNYISLMPTNLYGINDNFDALNSHVIPALFKRIHEAKIQNAPSVSIWGTGEAKREFLNVDDMAEATLFITEHYNDTPIINVGTGKDIKIIDLFHLMAKIIGFQGKILTDPSKPDGTPRKLLNIDKLTNLGWRPQISLEQGIAETYQWYLKKFNPPFYKRGKG